ARQVGFIAQEVEKVLPEVVDNSQGHYSMQYAPVTALLVEALKEQQKMIEELKAEVEKLKNASKGER
ncbi:MAG: tail fiber domain-containing protein, partial [Bacteroidales bacterium]